MSGVLALLWFATLALWAYSRRRPAPAAPRTAVPAEGQKQVLNDLKNACRSSDPRAAHAALARWLRRFGPPAVAGRPTVLARRVDDASLAAAIGALDAVAYGGADEGDWDGASLWRAFDRWRRAGAQLGGAAPAASDAVDDDLDLYATAR